MKLTKTKLYLSAISILLLGCAPNTPPEDYSVTTGWATNWQQNGGFEAKLKNSSGEEFNYQGMETPSNMVFIQGGTFVMGRTQEDVMQEKGMPQEQ